MSKGGQFLPAALGVVLASLLPGSAQAAFARCDFLPGASCARVAVPLDHAGRVSGSVGLHVVRLRSRRPTTAAMVYLSGGPGGTGTNEFLAALADRPIRRLRARYHLVTFDQRGTGRSGLLRCRAIERDARLRSTRAGEECANALGARRAFYTTSQTVEDLEAVRRELGVERLFLYGVSYGTKVALAYARAYPGRVERLLLDSVVDPDDTDEFGIEPYRNLDRTLRGLCPSGCGGVTADPVGDLAALTARLRADPVPGLNPVSISDLLFDADYAPELRAGVPAAVVSMLRFGNPGPLRRLIRAGRPLAEPGSPRDFSSARYATTCEETPLPWPRDLPVDQRMGELRARAAALGPDAFRPFDVDVLRADEIDLCLRWPLAPEAPVLRGSAADYPRVPALILQGGEDLRTPPTTSSRVFASLPSATRVLVPGVGHAVLGSDPSGCAQRRLRSWLAAEPVSPRCRRVQTGVPTAPVLPVRLGSLEAARGLSGRLGRTVNGISVTLEDLGFMLSPALALSSSNAGVAGGRLSIGRRGLRLRRFSAVGGLWVDGEAGRGGVLRARIGGSEAARGRIRVSGGGRLTGRLGGRRLRARLEAGARPRALLSAARRR